MNVNPRSIYNKINEFLLLLEQYEVDIAFMSESWERENLTLDQVIVKDNYKVISNVKQRDFVGGKPALIINEDKFHITEISPEPITVPVGVEAVWALITPKQVRQSSQVKKIVIASIYYRGPKSTKKTELFDHIAQTFNLLSSKYGSSGLHFILAGDTNRLSLKPILEISPNFVQMVKVPTRLNPEAILDPIITSMSKYYQEPVTRPPLDNDIDKRGKPSDHLIVLMKPLSNQLDCVPRKYRSIKFRPLPQSGINEMGQWLQSQKWHQVYQAKTSHQKAEIFQDMLMTTLNKFLPIKELKVSTDDKPWINHEIKLLDRKRKREFFHNKKSKKWSELDQTFKIKSLQAKQNYQKNVVRDLKNTDSSKWYTKIKQMSGQSSDKSDTIEVEEISHLPYPVQAERIAEHFAQISNSYKVLESKDIDPSLYSTDESPPVIFPHVVNNYIIKMKKKASTQRDDIPMKLISEYSYELANPLSHIINSMLEKGEYPNIWKKEIVTPVPKVFPPGKIDDLRKISGLPNFSKITEKIFSDYMISDMKATRDKSQYGNEKSISIQHYLIKMLHKILTSVNKNSKTEAFAVILSMVDWSKAFDRQSHILGVLSFICLLYTSPSPRD